MVRSEGKQAPPRRRRTRSVPEAEATPGPTAENDRRESRESRKKSARKERKRSRERSRSRSSTPGSGGRRRRSPKEQVTVEVTAVDSGASAGIEKAQDTSQRAQDEHNFRDRGVFLGEQQASVEQPGDTAPMPVASEEPTSDPPSQEVKP